LASCRGDSGGQRFPDGVASNLGVSITVTHCAVCRATNKTYQSDTASAYDFLRPYLTRPSSDRSGGAPANGPELVESAIGGARLDAGSASWWMA
jgi:hypothetical protein